MEPNFANYRPAIIKTLIDSKIHYDDLDDISQDVFLKIYRKSSTYDANKGAVATWVKRIAYTTAIDFFRKKRFDTEEITERTMVSPVVDSFEDDNDILNHAMSRLKEKDQVVLRLFYFEYASYKEVASTLSINVNRVGMEKQRAEQRLSKVFEKLGYEKSDFV
jgi:RNA polymerase sigma-70 factor (ECF subfamily)